MSSTRWASTTCATSSGLTRHSPGGSGRRRAPTTPRRPRSDGGGSGRCCAATRPRRWTRAAVDGRRRRAAVGRLRLFGAGHPLLAPAARLARGTGPASRAVDYDEDLLDRVEWELATLGLGSDHALRSLAERRLGIPLAPLPGQVVGYAKHLHAVEVLRHLRPILELPELTAETAAFVGPIVEVLAAAEGDERLDILAIGTV
ncbi:hypothetical protein [Tessaracoccus defluvii]|uniref:Uncharacterized protein n=1 Tax=Tessaracoccus defluvii TaxID=1285901 RepID=A0A7H0H2W6_9ACTN|nr:hypothetical protein [Tessaracoccus defluvii]QNP54882.1 hypothetical protein H9L22_11325 [Tessaracoccus defluvii]